MPRPLMVCLCGSTRFLDEFDAAALSETLKGRIVLSIGSTRRTDAEILAGLPEATHEAVLAGLGALHRAKIEMADEILVINPGGYVGESTRNEIEYARSLGKRVRYLAA